MYTFVSISTINAQMRTFHLLDSERKKRKDKEFKQNFEWKRANTGRFARIHGEKGSRMGVIQDYRSLAEPADV